MTDDNFHKLALSESFERVAKVAEERAAFNAGIEAADCIEAQAAEIERLRVEVKAQYDRGYYDGRTRSALEARGLEIRDKSK